MDGRATALMVVCALVLGGPASVATAQEGAPAIDEIIDRALARLEGETNAHVRIYTEVEFGEKKSEPDVQDIWVRDLQNLRSERAMSNMVIIETPDVVQLFIGGLDAVLRVPRETLEALGEDAREKLARAGIGLPSELLGIMADRTEGLSVVSEDTVEGAECWVLSVDDEHLDDWADTVGGAPGKGSIGDVAVSDVRIGLEKGSFILRGVYIAAALPAKGVAGVPGEMAVYSRIETIEEDIEISGALLTFEAPEGSTVVEWLPGQEPEEVAKAFAAAVAAGNKALFKAGGKAQGKAAK